MELKIRALRARAVDLPLARPLATGGGTVASAPFVLIDLQTDEGVGGCSYLFAYGRFAVAPLAQLVENLGASLIAEPVAPFDLERRLQRACRLIGAQGLTLMAISGIDMAAWDALAKAAGQPLARLLGGSPLAIPAYNSNGLGLVGPAAAGSEAEALAAPGFGALKIRLGYPDVGEDLAVVSAVRKAVGEGVRLMTDYNQCLSVAEAQQRLRRLDDQGLDWVEEPTRCDDYAGHARIRAKAGTPIQLGENCWGPSEMAKALEVGACDYFMPDLGKIGGVTGWLRAAALAEPLGLPVSSHLYPEVSAHMLAVTPTRHWLEYVDWIEPVLETPLRIEQGEAHIPDRPGHGMSWNEAAVERYLI